MARSVGNSDFNQLFSRAGSETGPTFMPATGSNRFASAINAAQTLAGRETGWAALNRHVKANRRLGALKNMRQEGLTPADGEPYYMGLVQGLMEVGDVEGAETVRDKWLDVRTKMENLPSELHKQKMEELELTNEGALAAANARAGRDSTEGFSEPSTASTNFATNVVHGLLKEDDNYFSGEEHEQFKEVVGAHTWDTNDADKLKDLRLVLKNDPFTSRKINEVATLREQLRDQYPNMPIAGINNITKKLARGYTQVRGTDGNEYIVAPNEEFYRVTPRGLETVTADALAKANVEPPTMPERPPRAEMGQFGYDLINAGYPASQVYVPQSAEEALSNLQTGMATGIEAVTGAAGSLSETIVNAVGSDNVDAVFDMLEETGASLREVADATGTTVGQLLEWIGSQMPGK